MLWVQFFICGALVIIFGSRLSAYADVISKKNVFSAGFMGVLFLAVITSCPEIFTSLGSITLVNAPDLASGDLIGAVIINIIVITVFSLLHKKASILKGQSRSNRLSAGLTILMLVFIMGSIFLRNAFKFNLGICNIGFDSMVIALIYISGMVIISRHEAATIKHRPKEKVNLSLWIKFIAATIVIIMAGFWLAMIGKTISDTYGWNEMLVGILFMAVITTMPEFTVSLSALKLNSVDMAVGNLLGSNFFNLFIIFILDVFFRRGEFLGFVSRSNIYPAALAAALTGATILRMRKRRK